MALTPTKKGIQVLKPLQDTVMSPVGMQL